MVLLDDNRLSRDGVFALIRNEPSFEVLATSAEIAEAMRRIREAMPDLVLLHLAREGNETTTLIGAIHGEFPVSRIVVMGLQLPNDDVASLVRAGAAGFIMATASLETLLHTIHSVANGNQVLPLELAGALFGQLKGQDARGRPKRKLDTKRLTKRERDVTALIIQGLSNKAIAERLHIALHTVKSHVHKVLAKLDVNSRLEIAAFSRNDPATIGGTPYVASLHAIG